MKHTLERARGSGFCLVILGSELTLSPWIRFYHAWITPRDKPRVCPQENNRRGPGSTPPRYLPLHTASPPSPPFFRSVMSAPGASVSVSESNDIGRNFVGDNGPSFI